ncbi:MAG: hypothetical protein AVDCRST_MAG86-679 [uncultured Truepera sp.]|uniref:AB hydrolase-1 domain-containing protein n=1 Tax=uncultured Truepera sp. TaxID=543023 RepID=A0A6J4UWB6_9DEIN|nr:MAG: hypothetical protein AVDCRST_MAG86-679 [uncultured Truepera sp.]
MTAPTYTPDDSPRLHVTEAGTPGAPTLLLLHAVATSGWMWERQAELLSDFHLLIPDLPGHGASNTVPWRSLDETVKLLAELVARKAEGPVYVVGLSLGAYVGLRLTEHFPERVDRAVLSGVNVLPFPNARVMGLMGYMMLPFLKTDAFLKANARGLRIPEVHYAGYRRSAKAMSRWAYLSIGRELMRFGLPAEVDRITCPTLVIAGEREQALIRESVPRLTAVLPDAQGYVVPGLGHGWSGEAPELFAQTVRAWVTEQPLPKELVGLEDAEVAVATP